MSPALRFCAFVPTNQPYVTTLCVRSLIGWLAGWIGWLVGWVGGRSVAWWREALSLLRRGSFRGWVGVLIVAHVMRVAGLLVITRGGGGAQSFTTD